MNLFLLPIFGAVLLVCLHEVTGQRSYGALVFDGYRPQNNPGAPRGFRANQLCAPTTRDVEGPYYKAGAPLLTPAGNEPPIVCPHLPALDRIFMNGTIHYTNTEGACGAPVRALLDVWQANINGDYSPHQAGTPDYTCRTRFYTNDAGFYSFGSVFPGRYLCDDCPRVDYRPTHIHFKITPLGPNNQPLGPELITQLYFAKDHYLGDNDSCPVCGADQPSQIANVAHYSDIKTYEGTWDVLWSPPPRAPAGARMGMRAFRSLL